mmetsp:Transcript_122323/g.380217  ORF Transcript_122323/g.380217 Transcript_122323/m.380217 type:complete len:146 (+) Transcript_122323:91-528(+)
MRPCPRQARSRGDRMPLEGAALVPRCLGHAPGQQAPECPMDRGLSGACPEPRARRQHRHEAQRRAPGTPPERLRRRGARETAVANASAQGPQQGAAAAAAPMRRPHRQGIQRQERPGSSSQPWHRMTVSGVWLQTRCRHTSQHLA